MIINRQISTIALLFAAGICFTACNEAAKEKHAGAIVLGDSGMIVTETDPQYLTDYVTDITVKTPMAAPEPGQTAEDTAKAVAQLATEQPVEKTAERPAQAATNVQGLTMTFKEVTVAIPGIETKSFKQQDLSRASGASYQLLKGNLNELRISGAAIQKVSQRYQTSVIVKNELGTLELDALSNSTDWKEIRGSNGVYKISGLDERNLQFEKASPAAIRAAVTSAAKNKRMSRSNINKWENSVRNVRAVNQKPLDVKLRSVMWKIEGKDANGKSFQKQVRIDLAI